MVAFSEAQQSEIEEALREAADEDSAFAAQLEAEYVREESDQFCGLFVKNLENVQGDERDIIILSICYGYDAGGKMLMNFGPINQRGGEKRLNVIFSRAKHHMAVVSSIRHHAITNDFNDGANSLKNFLQYAEAVSKGEALTRKAVELALAGDPHALRLCLERVVGPYRERAVEFTMPPIGNAADLAGAMAAVAGAAAQGAVTPREAVQLGQVFEAYVRAVEATEFERRLRVLERPRR